jgi:betaine-homocysteine S-methyltransferase
MGENKMRDGYTILETCEKLEELGADVVGLNCFRGPTTMLPYIREIRKKLKCHVAALPVPYRTTDKHPTFFNLPDNNGCGCPSPHGRTFPTAMDPLQCNRYEIGNFAKEVFDLGVKYIGVCCGASPMHIREVAEAVGFRVPASRFRENMSKHFMYGSDKKIPKHMKEYGNIA